VEEHITFFLDISSPLPLMSKGENMKMLINF